MVIYWNHLPRRRNLVAKWKHTTSRRLYPCRRDCLARYNSEYHVYFSRKLSHSPWLTLWNINLLIALPIGGYVDCTSDSANVANYTYRLHLITIQFIRQNVNKWIVGHIQDTKSWENCVVCPVHCKRTLNAHTERAHCTCTLNAHTARVQYDVRFSTVLIFSSLYFHRPARGRTNVNEKQGIII